MWSNILLSWRMMPFFMVHDVFFFPFLPFGSARTTFFYPVSLKIPSAFSSRYLHIKCPSLWSASAGVWLKKLFCVNNGSIFSFLFNETSSQWLNINAKNCHYGMVSLIGFSSSLTPSSLSSICPFTHLSISWSDSQIACTRPRSLMKLGNYYTL